MFLSAVSVLVVAQSSSEIPEGLMNNLVLFLSHYIAEILFVLYFSATPLSLLLNPSPHNSQK